MQATIQTRLVKNTSAQPIANAMQAKSAPRSTSGAKAGTRFLNFLISALGAPNV
jgi:hypothetical protein